jgi:hypothetical protein
MVKDWVTEIEFPAESVAVTDQVFVPFVSRLSTPVVVELVAKLIDQFVDEAVKA